jgi:hypothetical protein
VWGVVEREHVAGKRTPRVGGNLLATCSRTSYFDAVVQLAKSSSRRGTTVK